MKGFCDVRIGIPFLMSAVTCREPQKDPYGLRLSFSLMEVKDVEMLPAMLRSIIDERGGARMFPRFITAFLKSSGETGVVLMEHEGAQRVVIIDRDALQEISNPPRADETRLQEHVGTICEIAASKILLQPQSSFSRIRISRDDVEAWKASHDTLH
ncbi:hypothetical protein FHT82_001168 [Rhizobium sp. BK275]|nr:hypothetical protein [Rhizobium sp. BK275]